MAENKKMTKKEKFAVIQRIIDTNTDANLTEDIRTLATEFVAHEVQLLNNKSNKSGKLTKSQVENVAIKEDILVVLATGDASATAVSAELGLSVQKVSALLSQLVKENKVLRLMSGKATTFHLV